MKLSDIAKNLANRINQEHYIEHELKKIFDTAYKLGFDEAKKQDQALQLLQPDVISSISNDGLIELYRLAYNDGFDNVGDKKDIIKHRQKQIDKVKKKYCL